MKLKKALSYVLALAMIMTCISFTPITPKVKAESEPDYLTFTSDETFTVKLTTTLYIRVTAANGASKVFKYENGVVTPVGEPE